MRTMTTAFTNAIASKNYQPIYLFEGLFDSGALRFWTGYGNITWNGNIYAGSGTLIGISEVKETNAVEAVGAKFTLSGVPSSLVSFTLTENYQNRVVKLWLGLMSGGSLIADPVALFIGRADNLTIHDNGETSDIELDAENFLVDLLRPRIRQYTQEDQKLDYPSDLFLQYVREIQDKSYHFGPSQ